MEKEVMDQFLENKQNYMMDNIASAGDGLLGGVQAESGVAGEILGGKYDERHEEHDVADDDELKYVEEVQQSEKQQQQQQLQALKNLGLDDDGTYERNELAEKETSSNAAHDFGNENGGFVFGGDHQIYQHQQQQHDLFNMGNGHDTNGHESANVDEDLVNLISTGFEEKLSMMESDLDGFKNEGDLSPTSNVTESVDAFFPQIDVKIESKVEHQEMLDEEDPSSLATNTTNGTSSLSENVPPQSTVVPQANAFDDLISNLEDKENSDPLTPQRPSELDLDQAHSQLNPDAKEFVPSFGSNPASPTSPFSPGMQPNELVLSDIMETQMYFGQVPNAVAANLLIDDDFVAQSPHKGKADSNMDAITVPKELSEFEEEADKRPHECENQAIVDFFQRDEVMTPDQAIQQLPLDDLLTQDKENQQLSDPTNFQPFNFLDHGPETCVDHETDFNMQALPVLSSLQPEDDVMKRSMYVTSDDAIEDVLNSVQPIPTEIDSINNSFNEESATESAANQLAGDKELLQVEEKERISHSPSTEEIQMNLQNALNSSNKDIPQLPIDMDNANNMQESMYMEKEAHVEHDKEHDKEFQAEKPFEEEQMLQDQSQLVQTEENHYFEELKQEQHQQQELQKETKPEVELKYKDDLQNFQEELEHRQQPKEAEEQQIKVQQLLKEPPQNLNNELHYDQQTTADDPVTGTHPTEVSGQSLFADTTNSNDSLLNKAFESQDFHVSVSPIQITDEVFNIPATKCLNFDDKPSIIQEPELSGDVVILSPTEDEKHLLEETKEQQLFSISGLEQQMSEMMLNNTDGHLSQAEAVATTIATAAIEETSENLIAADEAATQHEEEQTHHHHQEQEKNSADDSFFHHEQECLKYCQQKDVEFKPQETEIIEKDLVEKSNENFTEQQHHQEQKLAIDAGKSSLIFSQEIDVLHKEQGTETNESPIQQQHHQEELASEVLIAAEPIIEPKEPAALENETEIVKSEFQPTEEIKAEKINEPEVSEELKAKTDFTLKEELSDSAPEITPEVAPVETEIIAATAAVATTAAAVAAKVAASPAKIKSETANKTLTKTAAATGAKTKVAAAPAAKKPIEAVKKTVGLVAKPRLAPAKPAATTADKKPIGKTTLAPARKPLSATTTTAASKVVGKPATTTTATTRTATAASKTMTAPKPATTATRTASSSTTATRKPAATLHAPLAKPRPASAPAKPTTLGLSATNGAPKTKPVSPRAALTSKSPAKTTTTNGVTKTTASSTLASRTKTTTSSVSASTAFGAATKTFTARPAPKFTSSVSTTTTTTSRRTVAGSTTASSLASTTTTTKTSSTPLRKSTPTKAAAAGRTPPKLTSAGGAKPKTPNTKPASSPAGKPAPIRKPVDKSAVVTNGSPEKITAPTTEEQQLHLTVSTENSDLQAVQLEQKQNGDSSIPMQTDKQQQSYLEPRVEQMDITNA